MKTAPVLILLVILLISGCAQASNIPASSTETTPIQSEEVAPMPESPLSASDQQSFLNAVAEQRNIATDQLKIVAVKEADWPDACLGLAGPDEFCAQMITPGWAISVSDEQQTWMYRTNLDMSQVKEEQQ